MTIFHDCQWADIALPPLTLGVFATVYGDFARGKRPRSWLDELADAVERFGCAVRRWTKAVARELRR